MCGVIQVLLCMLLGQRQAAEGMFISMEYAFYDTDRYYCFDVGLALSA